MRNLSLPILLGLSFIIVGTIPINSVQLLPTNLRVTVLDDLGNLEQGAVVAIFATEQD